MSGNFAAGDRKKKREWSRNPGGKEQPTLLQGKDPQSAVNVPKSGRSVKPSHWRIKEKKE